MKEQILLTHPQLQALITAIERWLDYTAAFHPTQHPRLSALQAVSSDSILPHFLLYLRRQQVQQHLRALRQPQPVLLPINFSLSEMIAVYECLPNVGPPATALSLVMELLQAGLLRYDAYIAL